MGNIVASSKNGSNSALEDIENSFKNNYRSNEEETKKYNLIIKELELELEYEKKIREYNEKFREEIKVLVILESIDNKCRFK